MNRDLSTFAMFVLALIAFSIVGFWLSSQEIVSSITVIFITVLLSIILILYYFLEQEINRSDFKRRFDAIQKSSRQSLGPDQSNQENIQQKFEELYDNRRTWIDRAGIAIQRIFNIHGSKLDEIRLNLTRAGFYGHRSVMIYLVSLSVAPALGLIIGGLWGDIHGSTQKYILLYMLFGAMLGFYVVRMFISSRAKSRQKSVYRDLPDAIDLLVIYAEAGIDSDPALRKISAVTRNRAPVCSQEINLLERELQVLPERGRAYANFATRIPISMVAQFCSIMEQGETSGAQIGESLRVLSEEMRFERLINLKQRAAKIPLYLQIPVTIFTLPALFIVVIGPAALRIIDQFSSGHLFK